MVSSAPHPAKFSLPVLNAIARHLDIHGPVRRVIDPFAGTGLVHVLSASKVSTVETVGVELEPEWAAHHPRTIVGDALHLPFPDDSFDCMVTSPCYGNRMADHHEAKDASKRNTYRHTLGRELHRNNSGAMQWSGEYRDFHADAWNEAMRVLTRDALVLLNVSNHIRGGREELVAEWHLDRWLEAGRKLVAAVSVPTPRNRNGANAHLRVAHEWLFVLRGNA